MVIERNGLVAKYDEEMTVKKKKLKINSVHIRLS